MAKISEYQGMQSGDTVAFRKTISPEEITIEQVVDWFDEKGQIVLKTPESFYFISREIKEFISLESIVAMKNYWNSIYDQVKTNHIKHLVSFLEDAILHRTPAEIFPDTIHLVEKIELDRRSTFAERTAKDFLKNFYYYYVDKPEKLTPDIYEEKLKTILHRINSCRYIED